MDLVTQMIETIVCSAREIKLPDFRDFEAVLRATEENLDGESHRCPDTAGKHVNDFEAACENEPELVFNIPQGHA